MPATLSASGPICHAISTSALQSECQERLGYPGKFEKASAMGNLEIRPASNGTQSRRSIVWKTIFIIGLVVLAGVYQHSAWISPVAVMKNHAAPFATPLTSAYGQFPLPNDKFHFIPCTSNSLLPGLDDQIPEKTWATRFDANPDHWSWGKSQPNKTEHDENPYSGRGIYLCGYIDVPLDYTNKSESRIARLAVTKFQVSGLALIASASCKPSAGKKSQRTIVIEPGGPGGSMSDFTFAYSNLYCVICPISPPHVSTRQNFCFGQC